jgi:TRAP-type C4-dicarboxylate transport system permease small subunit
MPAKQRILKAVEVAIFLTSVILMGMAMYQILARFADMSIRWTDEFMRLVCIWGVFLTTPILVRHHSLIKIDFFVALFPKSVRVAVAWVEVVLIAVTFAFVGILAIYQAFDTWNQTTPGLEWPNGVFTLPIAVGFLAGLFFLRDYLKREIELIDGAKADVTESMI